ncbi:MAG: signal peptide peptidase SppA [Flavobacteriaceae bacterium]|jgi:protease-4|nr:signal peptide peptidase SppA [Flavobacteriaceae bacterium]
MKKFLIQVLAVIVGISLLTGVFIFGMFIIGAISESTSKITVKENSVLEITLKQPVMESPSEKSVSVFSFNQGTSVYLRNILDLIKHAKTDDKIKGISLKIEDVNGGYAQISEIRQALQDFKQSKKFVYAYSNNSSQKTYYLSSVADSLFLNLNAMTEFAGMSMEVMFLKNFGDKYGISFDVIRHGKYKSAVEPYLQDHFSDENRQQLKELGDNIWSKISSDISQSRKLSINDINIAADSLYGFVAEYAVKQKLADKLVTESQYYNIIKKKLGVTEDKKFNKISLTQYSEATDLKSRAKDKIAVLYASGEIYSGKGNDDVYSQTIIKQIKEIKDDDHIKAVVLRVNSPGGDGNASAEILYELAELKKEKPLIVSFSDYAASGGYYIAMAADKIYAQENTITGSIGVFGILPNVKKLSNNLGINFDHVATNANSLYYSPFEGASDGMKTVLTKDIEIFYKKFVGVVMNNRKKTFEQVDALGGGRVWSGKQALQNGLVDAIGTFGDAIAFAAQKAKLKEYQVIDYPKEKPSFERFMEMFFPKNDDDDTQVKATENLLKKELGAENYRLYQKVKNIQQQKGILYLMPFDIEFK